MGTRHLICVLHRGRFLIAQYGQFDGYPSGAGLALLRFLLSASNIQRLTHGLQHIYTPTEEEEEQLHKTLDQEQRAHLSGAAGASYGAAGDLKMKLSCPSMSRMTSAEILEVVAGATAEAPVPISMELEFIYDGLFCEWAYVVDLDAGVLEVFCGLEEEHEGSSPRFKDVDGAEAGWVPALVKRFAFAELPATDDEFLAVMREAQEVKRRERQARKQEESGDAVAAAL